MKRFYCAASIGLIALFLLHIMVGTYFLSPAKLWAALWDSTHEDYFTVVSYRLPRAILAVILGAALAVSGVLIQTVVRNPLASPDILGISQAGGLTAVVVLLFLPTLPVYLLPFLTFLGGIVSFILLWLLGGWIIQPFKMAMLGVALAALWSALTQYLLLRYPMDSNLALLWLTGSLWGRNWQSVAIVLPPLLIALPMSVYFCRELDLLTLGEEKPPTLGVSLQKTQILLLLLAVALATTAVATAGPMSFLGLIAPHITRYLVGGKHLKLLPSTLLIGAIVLLCADIFARIIAPPIELPAGILTAILGAPYFFYLLMKRS